MNGGSAALYTFVGYIMAVFVLAWLANRLLKQRSFLSEYFLGSRSLVNSPPMLVLRGLN